MGSLTRSRESYWPSTHTQVPGRRAASARLGAELRLLEGKTGRNQVQQEGPGWARSPARGFSHRPVLTLKPPNPLNLENCRPGKCRSSVTLEPETDTEREPRCPGGELDSGTGRWCVSL